MMAWIKVEDELPEVKPFTSSWEKEPSEYIEVSRSVIAYSEGKNYIVWRKELLKENRKSTWECLGLTPSNVTHWMELPKPPIE